MPLARFKDLCFDAADPEVIGRFWSEVLGLHFEPMDDGDVRLSGPTPGHTVWINRVPEPKTVKHRIHVDVHGTTVEALTALGATVIDGESFRWTVMADPEGGEFCFFPRDEPPAYRLYELGVNCADHEAQSAWWAEVLGAERVVDEERGFSWIENIPGAPFESIDFAPVPEPKTVKNRVHIDVVADDVDALVAAGATVLRRRDDEIVWDVLADPEGDEFCVFDPT